MIKVAIIGSTGQLGTDLVQVLNEDGNYKVFPLDHAEVDCAKLVSLREALAVIGPDVVVNCAAFVAVDECEDRPEDAFRVNAIGAWNVARVCADLNALCVYISTDYVFDGEKGKPYTEEDPPRPINIYGASKLAGEYFVGTLCPTHFIVRTSGLYGVAGSRGKGGNFVETMIRLAKENKPIRVVKDEVLTPTYTRDLAEKIKELLQTDVYGFYHITNSGQCCWYEFAKKIFELLDLRPDFGPTTAAEFGAKARRPAYSVLAHNKLNQLDLNDLRPWPEALRAYLKDKGHLAPNT